MPRDSVVKVPVGVYEQWQAVCRAMDKRTSVNSGIGELGFALLLALHGDGWRLVRKEGAGNADRSNADRKEIG